MSATGRGAVRVEEDFYATPDWCVRAIAKPLLEKLGSLATTILDPCAGEGAILRSLMGLGAKPGLMTAIEINEARVRACRSQRVGTYHGDALTGGEREWGRFNKLVIMNPPFSLALSFVTKAIEYQSRHGGITAALLPQGFLGSAERRHFHRSNPCDWYQLTSRPSFCVSIKCKERPRRGPRDGGGCMYRATISPETPRPTECPACGAGLDFVTTDAIDYGWALWGPGMGNRLFWIDKEE